MEIRVLFLDINYHELTTNFHELFLLGFIELTLTYY